MASFDATDISTQGGTLSGLSGSGLIRTAVFTPTPNLASGNASISVAANSYSDAAGNSGSAASSPAISITTQVPSILAVNLSRADGIQNNTLNAGDVVFATVTMSDATMVIP